MGRASGAVVSPAKQPILVGSYGVAADGKLSGDLGKLRGAALLVDLTSGTDLYISDDQSFVVVGVPTLSPSVELGG